MAKGLLKNKDSIPTEIVLEKVLGDRFVKYQSILKKLLKRQLSPEMYWYGPSSGWAPRFCVGEITICGIYLAQDPLMGLVGIGNKINYHLDQDLKLDPRARVLYKIATKKGPLKWVEAQLTTNSDIDIFLSLIDGKLRALFKTGITLKTLLNKNIKLYKTNIKEKFAKNPENKLTEKRKTIQIGPSKFYDIKTIFAAGKG